jgi:carlactone synthase / all-trans-10'-apo-beta-carotenal 13,14-cleaving dioxygenase
MSPTTMASSFCVFAAMSGAAAGGSAVSGRLATGAQVGKQSKRPVAAQPLAASVVIEMPPPPVIAPPPARPVADPPRRRGSRGTDGGGSGGHTAWTSVRQERWEGALEVEGELPLWLVGANTYASLN